MTLCILPSIPASPNWFIILLPDTLRRIFHESFFVRGRGIARTHLGGKRRTATREQPLGTLYGAYTDESTDLSGCEVPWSGVCAQGWALCRVSDRLACGGLFRVRCLPQ